MSNGSRYRPTIERRALSRDQGTRDQGTRDQTRDQTREQTSPSTGEDPRCSTRSTAYDPADWEAGLAWIAGILDDIEADWFLMGSAALAVRGMDVRPGGVDVALAEAGADRLGPTSAPVRCGP